MTATMDPEVAGRPWDGAVFDGTFRTVPDTITVTAPATGKVIGNVGRATTGALGRAVEQPRVAQRDWAALPYGARVAVLLKAAQLLEADPTGWPPGWSRRPARRRAKRASRSG